MGFGWFGLGDFGILAGIVGFGGGLCVCGAKRGFCVGVWAGKVGGLGGVGKFAPGSCLICENLSTFQNSQNFVNFHLSKIKGGTLSNPALS